MAEEHYDSERPHDETWWARELHRNEKLMDKYMAVLGDNPDWDKWRNPEDLYNKVISISIRQSALEKKRKISRPKSKTPIPIRPNVFALTTRLWPKKRKAPM